MSGAFERDREAALMTSAGSRHTTRKDFAALADETAQARNLFVVDQMDLLNAEVADLLMRLTIALIGRWGHRYSPGSLKRNVVRFDIAGGLVGMSSRRSGEAISVSSP